MMNEYQFEPTLLEVVITELVGNTLGKSYYRKLIKELSINAEDKVLDYCSGSGIISKEIAKYLKNGQLVYADVSEKWLMHAAKKLMHCKNSKAERIQNFQSFISGGDYDIILVHFALHDFPDEYQQLIVNQLIKNLKPSGRIYFREPLGSSHGIEMHELANILEQTKKLSYEYKIEKNRFVGKYVHIKATLK